MYDCVWEGLKGLWQELLEGGEELQGIHAVREIGEGGMLGLAEEAVAYDYL